MAISHAQEDFHETKAPCSHAKSALQTLSTARRATDEQAKIDAKYYLIDITIDPGAETVSGSVIGDFELVDSSITYIELDLVSNMTVSSTEMNGLVVEHTRVNDFVHIPVPDTIRSGMVRVKISYSGQPEASGFGSFEFSSYNGQPWIWSLSEPYGARSWWPCKDDPADKADSVDIVVTVPNPLIVASNGVLVGTMDIGEEYRKYYWQERYPIVTYLVSVAIHPYLVWYDQYVSAGNDTMPIEFYVRPDYYDTVYNDYLKTTDMLTVFSGLFGEYPFIDEKYGHAEFGWGGGMEHQTITSLGGWSESLIAHELAHQWWGDMITCASFHHIWLNEGFATYAEALWWESQYGWEAYHQDMMNNVYYYGGTIYVDNPVSTSVIFSKNLSYNKASWVLHMLRHVVGDSTFFDILKAYANAPDLRHNSITTEQFRDLCETVAGIDLEYYFDQWIYGEYFPDYTLGWIQSADTVTISVTQTQTTGTFFRMPIDLQVICNDTTFIQVVENSQVNESFQIALPGNSVVERVVLDPNDWILKMVTYMNNGHEPVIPERFSLWPAYPNPFNSAVTIPFAVSNQDWIRFSVYNLLGELVWNYQDFYHIGEHDLQWNGYNAAGRLVPSGVYFIRMEYTGGFNSQKIVLLK